MLLRIMLKMRQRFAGGVSFARAAAPEGGASVRQRRGVWGCVILFTCASGAMAQEVLPSGQTVELHEVLAEAVGGGDWLRFRFVAPRIDRENGDISFFDAKDDFIHLCEVVALPYVAEHALSPERVVVTLMDRVVTFGAFDPDATQFIEGFSVAENTCTWEGF